jgi:hypothetical protein
MNGWNEDALKKAEGRNLQPKKPTTARTQMQAIEDEDTPVPASKPTEKGIKWLNCQQSTYPFHTNTTRIVFPLVPNDQVQAFIEHCQNYKP